MLDEVLNRAGQEVEIEDILGEELFMPAVKTVVGKTIKLIEADRKAGGLPTAVKAAADRLQMELPDGWKASVAIELVSSWAQNRTVLPDPVLDLAEMVFKDVRGRFEDAVAMSV